MKMQNETSTCIDVSRIYNSTEGIVDKEAFNKFFGGFNDYPPNWKEVTEAEFSGSLFFFYEPLIRDHRQMRGDDYFGKYTEATLYFFHDGSGVAMSADHRNKKVRYFTFGVSQHEFKEVTIGRCLTRKTCTKCGYEETVDSSD